MIWGQIKFLLLLLPNVQDSIGMDTSGEEKNITSQEKDWHGCIGVNIGERKSGTERTKKRKKRELVFSPPPGAHLVQ